MTMMMEVIRSSETLVLTRDGWHNIPEDGILYIPPVSGLIILSKAGYGTVNSLCPLAINIFMEYFEEGNPLNGLDMLMTFS
jgi:hypothetical protein